MKRAILKILIFIGVLNSLVYGVEKSFNARAVVIQPILLEVVKDIDFGPIVVGTQNVRPKQEGSILVTARPGRRVECSFNRTVLLTRDNGVETMSVNFRGMTLSYITVPDSGNFNFNFFSEILNVSNTPGTYSGTTTLRIVYDG